MVADAIRRSARAAAPLPAAAREIVTLHDWRIGPVRQPWTSS